MTEKELLRLTGRKPFAKATIVSMDEVVFDPVFRPFCEQNFCGMYGVNHSCPPECGTPAEMEQRMRSFSHALVLQSEWSIDDYTAKTAVRAAKAAHNAASQEIIMALRASGAKCLLAGCGCCMLCDTCGAIQGSPCQYPDEQYSCMSAYCIYVRDLAEKCGMQYNAGEGKVAFFSMLAFNPRDLS